MAAARCIGASHSATGTPCQDQVKALSTSSLSVAVLADGAGSAPLSHHGAARVVSLAAGLLLSHYPQTLRMSDTQVVSWIVTELLAGLDGLAAELSVDGPCHRSDLASTILAVVVGPEAFLAIHIGDGVIGIEEEAAGTRRQRVLSEPDNGEFSNETVFVTSRDAVARGRVHRGSSASVSGFVLMSDGPQASLHRRADNSLAPATAKLIQSVRELENAEVTSRLERTLVEVISRRTHDDCSLAVLAR